MLEQQLAEQKRATAKSSAAASSAVQQQAARPNSEQAQRITVPFSSPLLCFNYQSA
jgi:hypothetical protein